MKEMTDQELTDKIRRAFDEYEDPAADYGWQELRRKYPENNRKPLLIWWGARAAALLIFGGLWFIPAEENIVQQQQVIESRTQPVKEKEVSKADKIFGKTLRASNTRYANTESAEPLNYSNHGTGDQTSETRAKNISLIAHTLTLNTNISNLTPHTSHLIPITSSLIPHTPRHDSFIQASTRSIAMAQTVTAEKDILVSPSDFGPEEKADEKTAGFSFFAGSFFNYAEGSETTLNFGAGFSSDIKLGSNLRFSTGISIAKNSLSYPDQIPSASARRSASLALDSPSPGSNMIIENNNLTTITNYSADILSLDIPLNLKYLIVPEENKLYISAGISSATYLNETYAFNYRRYNIASGNYINTTQEQEISKHFGVFDLARTLNISMGLNTQLSKSQNITIEPFIKYPLGGLGSENLKFGSSGINLKLNFSSERKK